MGEIHCLPFCDIFFTILARALGSLFHGNVSAMRDVTFLSDHKLGATEMRLIYVVSDKIPNLLLSCLLVCVGGQGWGEGDT